MSGRLFFIMSFVTFVGAVHAQKMNFVHKDSIDVAVNSKLLTNAWAGGLNCPQFSTIDLNNDAIKDLFVFDRASNQVKTFINKGTPNAVAYIYAPQYEGHFPKMSDYALLYDYNCDGKEDIFTASGSGIRVYKNISSINNIAFTKVSDQLYTDYGSMHLNLYVSSVCLPAYTDIDNDGDIDILTFEIGGGYVELHRNQSKELYGTCDSLVYKADKDCWGHFAASSMSNDVTLGVNCTAYRPARMESPQHSGSTLLAIDNDGDGDKELLVGDIIANNILFLSNGGTVQNANITSKTDSFPANDVKINLHTFPAVYYLDVDNDGLNDLIVASNNPSECENATGIWFYKNIGSTSAPVFHLQTKAFLQDEMIDVGEGPNPVFFDYDADGLKDLLIGNYGYYAKPQYLSGFTLFKNTGTVLKPSFNLITTDYANINQYGLKAVSATFGDIDGDGDADMLIGEEQGYLYLLTNSSGAGNPAQFQFNATKYFNIDAGSYSSPCFYDVDNDGILDLLVGTRNGNVEYYHNDGTKTTANFTIVTKTFGEIDVRSDGNITGHSKPMVLSLNGKKQIVLGSEKGTIFVYNGIESNISGTFNKEDTALSNINTGIISAISATDLNGDGAADLVVCNQLGGCELFYQSGSHAITNIKGSNNLANVMIIPNPAFNIFTLKGILPYTHIEITDILGKIVFSLTDNYRSDITLNCADWAAGIYICKIASKDISTQVKLIITH